MVFWNPKKKRTTAKPKTTASISKPKVGSVKQELNILPQPKKTDKSKFDCRKICVTKDVQEVLWSYYREEKNQTDEQIASILLIGGPKANLEEYGILEYRAEVENGFVSCGENPDGC